MELIHIIYLKCSFKSVILDFSVFRRPKSVRSSQGQRFWLKSNFECFRNHQNHSIIYPDSDNIRVFLIGPDSSRVLYRPVLGPIPRIVREISGSVPIIFEGNLKSPGKWIILLIRVGHGFWDTSNWVNIRLNVLPWRHNLYFLLSFITFLYCMGQWDIQYGLWKLAKLNPIETYS